MTRRTSKTAPPPGSIRASRPGASTIRGRTTADGSSPTPSSPSTRLPRTRSSTRDGSSSPARARAAGSPSRSPGCPTACAQPPSTSRSCATGAGRSTSPTRPVPRGPRYLATRRDLADRVFASLAYFDGLQFAVAGQRPGPLLASACMDEICPPSTVFAAYNHYAGPKRSGSGRSTATTPAQLHHERGAVRVPPGLGIAP